MKTRKSKRIFGMSQMQIIVLAVMACFAFTIITGMAGLIIFNTSLGSQPFTLIPVLPTMTIVHPTRTPLQTATSQPTFTKAPTATRLPTKTITPTPTLWFQVNARDLIPAEQEMPSGYKIDTGASGSISNEYAIEEYMVTYTNNYPNDPRNKSGDPYLVVYIAAIFNTVGSATSSYDVMDENWISDNFGKMFNISSSPQTISPSPTALSIDGIERATAYISNYNGVSVPGFFVFIKLQNHNGVFVIRTLSHAPFTDEQRTLDGAKYFTSLFVPKLTRMETSSQVDQTIQTPTYALPATTKKTFVNVSTGFCLDSNANGAVYTLGCNGGDYQNWESQGERLINVSTGFCLDSNAEGKVYAIGCNGGNYQNWLSSDKRLINVATGLCLDSNANGKVYTLDCNGGNYQNWK